MTDGVEVTSRGAGSTIRLARLRAAAAGSAPDAIGAADSARIAAVARSAPLREVRAEGNITSP